MNHQEYKATMAKTKGMVVELADEAAANVAQLNAMIESDYIDNMEVDELAGTAIIMEYIIRLQNKMLWNIETFDLNSKLILKEAMEEIAIEGVIGGEMRDMITRLNELNKLIDVSLETKERYRKKINTALAALEEAFGELKEEIVEKAELNPESQEMNSLLRMMTHSNW